MSKIITPRLPENRLIERIENLERLMQQLRTEQITGSDTEAPLTAGVVSTADHTLSGAGTWEDFVGVTIDLTITEPSIIMVLMCPVMPTNFLIGPSIGRARVTWDGVAKGNEAIVYAEVGSGGIASEVINVMQMVRITENTAGTYTLKMQGKGDTGAIILSEHSNMSYWVFRQ